MAIYRPGIDPEYQRLCEIAESKGYVVELHGERERIGSDATGHPLYRLALTLLRVSEHKRIAAATRRLVLALGA